MGEDEIRIRSKELVKRLKEEAGARGVPVQALLWELVTGGKIRDKTGRSVPKVGQNGTGGFELPGWVPGKEWEEFEESRRKVRKPMTDAARRLTIGKLAKLREAGNDPGKVLEQSVERGWQGVFPLNGGNGHVGRKTWRDVNDETFADLEEVHDDSTPGDESGGA